MWAIRYVLGEWPVKFKRDEMGAAALFCAGNDNAVFDEPDRTEALGKLEFIRNLAVDVDTVDLIVENRSDKNMPYVVLAMNDGSHLCSCRTLQTLGLCCRRFWLAMCLSCKFRFHIGILNQHWLVEQGRRPMTATVEPKCAIARNHAATVEEDAIREAPVVPAGSQAGRWQAITDTTTIESSLVAAAERAVQGVLKVAFCSFLDQLPPRLPPRPFTNPTFTSFQTQTPITLTKELLHLPDAPSLLAQR